MHLQTSQLQSQKQLPAFANLTLQSQKQFQENLLARPLTVLLACHYCCRLLQEALESATAKPGTYGGAITTTETPATAATPPAARSGSSTAAAGVVSLAAAAAVAAMLL